MNAQPILNLSSSIHRQMSIIPMHYLSSSGVIKHSRWVLLKLFSNCHSTGNRTSCCQLGHHILLTSNTTMFTDVELMKCIQVVTHCTTPHCLHDLQFYILWQQNIHWMDHSYGRYPLVCMPHFWLCRWSKCRLSHHWLKSRNMLLWGHPLDIHVCC